MLLNVKNNNELYFYSVTTNIFNLLVFIDMS